MPVIIGRAANVMTYLVRFMQQQDEEGCNGELILAMDMPEKSDEVITVMPMGTVSKLTEEQRKLVNGEVKPEGMEDKDIIPIVQQPRETFYKYGRPDVEGRGNGYDKGVPAQKMEYIYDDDHDSPSPLDDFHKAFFARYAAEKNGKVM